LKKVSVYLDERTWGKFKASVFARYGSLRNLSQEVEALFKSLDTEDALLLLSDKMGLGAKGLITSEEVKKNRPALKGPPSEEIIREMRGSRLDRTIRG